MAYAQLISTEYVYTWGIIPKDVDADLITTFIRQAQDIDLEPVLGYNLLNKLMNDYANTSTTPYLTLMQNFIMPALAYRTTYRAFPFIWARVNNKSIVLKDGDTSSPVNSTDRKELEAILLSTAEFYAQKIRKEIINNPGSYPEYFVEIGRERIKPKPVNYFCGIYTTNYGAKYPRPYDDERREY